jgi:formylglycine-generating enzyme required for sulfatase activity
VPEVVNSIGMRLALIPPGRFRMGSPPTEKDREAEEVPHEVQITGPFYLGVCQVTQRQWKAVMGGNPSSFCAVGGGRNKVRGLDTDDFPVEQTSWDDVQEFLTRLAARPQEAEAGRTYRLPTEAEWEYACRAGTTTPFHFGDDLLPTQATFEATPSPGAKTRRSLLRRPTPVGSYRPNAFGLFDVHGNVWEWCSDWYDKHFYSKSEPADPRGPEASTGLRVLRGGSWQMNPALCRAAKRVRNDPGHRSNVYGFRVACDVRRP